MKKIVLKYGLYGGVLIVTLFCITLLTPFAELDLAIQEVAGYLSIFISLLFVFFGIKSYRDKVNSGAITFGKGLGLGMKITLIPAAMFGIFDIIYLTLINPGFYQSYHEEEVARVSAELEGAELAAKLDEMNQFMAMAESPWFVLFDFALMALTVIIIGFIISLISAFILRKG